MREIFERGSLFNSAFGCAEEEFRPALRGEPLRIAMFTEAYPPIISGVAIATRTLVAALRAAGHSVDLFTPRHPDQPDDETDIERLPSLATPVAGWIPLSLPLSPLSFRDIVGRRYDVVHTQHPFMLGTTARALARRQGVPLVATIHTQYEQYVHYWTPWHRSGRRLVRHVVREFCNDCHGLITVGEGMVPMLRAAGITCPIEVIPNAIEERFLRADPAGVRHELGLGESEPFLLSIGRLAPEKNLLFLLESLAPLLRQRARLVLVGDGPLRSELERRAEELEVRERVLFVGAMSHAKTARIYAAADVFLMPSLTEVNPLSLGEALAAGTPVVACDSFSAREAITPGHNGIIVPHDTCALRHAVQHLLEHPDELRRMGISARAAAHRRNANAAQRTAQLYRSLIEETQFTAPPRNKSDAVSLHRSTHGGC